MLLKFFSGSRSTQPRKFSFVKCYVSDLLVFLESHKELTNTLNCHSAILQITVMAFHEDAALEVSPTYFSDVMAIMYPMAISIGAETLVSIKRLEDFLVVDEQEISTIKPLLKPEISVENVSASWTLDNSVINNVSFQVPQGTLCAIIGPVGAGKSSLLQILLGELPPTSGRIELGGKISYACQEPWLFATSIRQNILFGKPYEKSLYKRVVKVCALENDFKQLSHGDKTRVGEKGASLSGGQRARVNLARAIYRGADVYLLDDPLSAVDTHVGKHLFEKCILKYLKDKTRILVTHQLQYLKKADVIVVLNKGSVEAMGTFEELSQRNLDFTKMLALADETEEAKLENCVHIREEFNENLEASANFNQDASISDVMESEEKCDRTNSRPLLAYLKMAGGVCFISFVIIVLLLSQIACTCTDLWVALWTSQEEIRYSSISKTKTNDSYNLYGTTVEYDIPPAVNHSSFAGLSHEDIFDEVKIDQTIHTLFKTNVALYIYGILIILAILLTVARSLCFFKASMLASKNIHNKMFHCLLRVPMRFFNSNPSGRVLNRFSKDIGAIDDILPRVLMEAIQIFLVMSGILVNVGISNYFMIIPMIILGAIFLKVRAWYTASAKDIKHLEGSAKSPVFSHISATLNGLTTIRAFQAQDASSQEFDEHQDVHTSAWFLTIMCTVFFGLWLDVICLIFLTCVAFGFVISMDMGQYPNSSLVGLALSQAMILTGMLQYGMRQTAEVVNQLTSVERVLEYTKLDQEGPFVTPKGKLPLLPWPSLGRIEFKNLSLSYIPGCSVLKSLNFIVQSGEKVGIVGRTGAGKSSLISALFRLSPTEGCIFIDDLNTTIVGLHDLRKKISIIPQEPVLFSATLRYNLDPFGEFPDDKLWEVLDEVELKDAISSLDFQVSEGGKNFSLGQRQLLCLARALLRNNKILVLDEATANVDARTDGLIQSTIRRKFKDCTVLTIAHRLNTIMDSDKVIVMEAGSVMEADHPHQLLQSDDGIFMKMVEETGSAMTEQLKGVALNAWKVKEATEDQKALEF